MNYALFFTFHWENVQNGFRAYGTIFVAHTQLQSTFGSEDFNREIEVVVRSLLTTDVIVFVEQLDPSSVTARQVYTHCYFRVTDPKKQVVLMVKQVP